MIRTFSCTYWLFVYILCEACIHVYCSFFNWASHIFSVDLEKFFVYSEYKTFHIHFLTGIFWWTEILNCDQAWFNIFCPFMVCAFCVFSKKFLPCWGCDYIAFCFLLEALWFWVLHLSLWPISNDFVCKEWYRSFLYRWSIVPTGFVKKNFLSHLKFPLHFFQKLMTCICTSILKPSALFHLFICLYHKTTLYYLF